jgi:hypothetical protein
VAVAAFGALLNTHLRTAAPGLDPNVALDPGLRSQVPVEALDTLRAALGGGLHSIFVGVAAVALLGLLAGLVFPGGSARSHAHGSAPLQKPGAP